MDTRKGYEVNGPFQYGAQTLKLMLLGAMIVLCLLTINQFKHSRYFPIKKVRVYGIHYLNSQEVRQTLLPLVKRNFFTINVDNIRDQLLQMPWIADLNVRRVWPDEVEINIVEKNPLARWMDASLITESGEVFTPGKNAYPDNLPKFIGPAGMQMEMIKYFNEMNRLLIPLHAKISYLELTPYSTWKLALDNGITLQIGHKDILNRLAQFVRVYPKIVRNHSGVDVDYVDLRYPNGMAVRWKKSIRA